MELKINLSVTKASGGGLMITSKTKFHYVPLIALGLLISGCFASHSSDSQDNDQDARFEVQTIVDNLEHPWGLAFLPGDTRDLALVTEKPGRLQLLDLSDGSTEAINGLPDIVSPGQGGLMDIALHPDFVSGQQWIYLSYVAEGDEGGYATHVSRGRLDIEGRSLLDVELLHIATPFSGGGQHFGSRLVFDQDWRLYITVGDRGDRHSAQDLESHWGKILRLEDDGRIPDDNPFVGQNDALDAIYSYGHRNPQGLTIDPFTGLIWENEHGQMNGDEINIIDEAGGNYGWPVATYSREYGSGEPIGDLPHEREDVVDPVYYWDGTRYEDREGFPPSGMAIYDGDAFPVWSGDLFMGNLAHRYLGRFERQGSEIVKEETLLRDRGWRIRDVRVHPADGSLYVLVDSSNGRVVRLIPEE